MSSRFFCTDHMEIPATHYQSTQDQHYLHPWTLQDDVLKAFHLSVQLFSLSLTDVQGLNEGLEEWILLSK